MLFALKKTALFRAIFFSNPSGAAAIVTFLGESLGRKRERLVLESKIDPSENPHGGDF